MEKIQQSCSCTRRSSPRKAFPRFSSTKVFPPLSSAISWLRTHRQQVVAQEALKKAKTEHHEINCKAQATTNQSVTSLMGELQRAEAKQVDFNHTISKNEAKIDRIVSQLQNQKKQIKKIEKNTIPMKDQVWRGGLASSRKQEIGTDLTSTLSEEDRGMLA